jgi:glycosyltransferase involved in cell wall biosynthesis
VFDNNSTDDTVAIASAAGALIRREALQGKGNVVRRMFADVDADAYVMADGDATYDPSYAADMVNRLFEERLDMVVGTRVASHVSV